jgi:hypothetical protein
MFLQIETNGGKILQMKLNRRRVLAMPLAMALTSYLGQSALARQQQGFVTSRPAQLRPLVDGVKVQPILSTGDTLPNGYTMAAIPDGLGAFDNRDGTFTLLMNHELTPPENLSNARVSQLVIDKKSLSVLDASYPIHGAEGYHRFCSATMVGPQENFDNYLFLTGEEATDGPFGGITAAVDPQTGKVVNLPWAGHFAHENMIGLPHFGKIVVLSTEDAAPGYLYLYIASTQADFLAGNGQLYVFVGDNGKKTPADLSKAASITGRFVPITQGENKNASTLKAAATAKGAMVFTRLEDLVYDASQPGVFYFITTGRSQFLNPATGKPYDAKGRLHVMKLDLQDPTKVLSLSLLLDGDTGDEILNPDNIASSVNTVMMLEDINDEFRGVHPGRVLRYDLHHGSVTPVAEVVQKDFAGNPIPGDIAGAWESSGIINVSHILGPNKWLLVTQAHTLKVAQFGDLDESGQLLLLTVPGSTHGQR